MEQATEIKLSILDLAMKGGWIMVVLAILSIIAVYIFIERFIVVKRAPNIDKSFMERIREYIKDGKIDSAKALCSGSDTPIARMIEKGLSRLGRPLNDINTAIENVGNLEVAKLEKGVTLLSMIASAAPMIGFLGTVTGMIRAFYNMSMAGNNIDIELLSSGIYEAMVTTVGGLIVGILAYVFYTIIVAKIQNVVNLLESKTTEFMDVLNEPAKNLIAMAIKTRNKIGVSFNSSSMSDLVFLLLIFFMLTSTLVAPNAIKLLLPSSNSKTMAKQTVTVYINDLFQYYVDETPVTDEELASSISAKIEGQTDATIVLRSDKSVPVQYVVNVIDAVNEINNATQQNHKVILATSPKK